MALKKKCDGFFSFFFRVAENINEINALSLWLFLWGACECIASMGAAAGDER